LAISVAFKRRHRARSISSNQAVFERRQQMALEAAAVACRGARPDLSICTFGLCLKPVPGVLRKARARSRSQPGAVPSAGFSSRTTECVHATKERVQANIKSVGQAAESVEAFVDAPASSRRRLSAHGGRSADAGRAIPKGKLVKQAANGENTLDLNLAGKKPKFAAMLCAQRLRHEHRVDASRVNERQPAQVEDDGSRPVRTNVCQSRAERRSGREVEFAGQHDRVLPIANGVLYL
jgi:hypothetical protein